MGGDATWVGYLEATVAAGMVGGLADWFAVTALFRRPLRLPIPHTAIIVERKDAFGRTLGDFVQTSFLTPDIIAERVRAAEVVSRLAACPSPTTRPGWPATWRTPRSPPPTCCATRRCTGAGGRRPPAHRGHPAGPAGRPRLQVMTEGGRHHDLLDVALRAV